MRFFSFTTVHTLSTIVKLCICTHTVFTGISVAEFSVVRMTKLSIFGYKKNSIMMCWAFSQGIHCLCFHFTFRKVQILSQHLPPHFLFSSMSKNKNKYETFPGHPFTAPYRKEPICPKSSATSAISKYVQAQTFSLLP